jgi:hypothetical protein
MEGWIDDLSRTLATTRSRRTMLRVLGGGLAAALAAAVGRPPRDVAAVAATTPMGSSGSFAALAAAPLPTSEFTSSYQGWSASTNTCGQSYGILGQEPTQDGRFPLYIYVAGTFQDYSGSEGRLAVQEMASRGFVAASVGYSNGWRYHSCAYYSSKSDCIFRGSRAKSALATLCGRAKADCSKGVVLQGLSQGAMLATLARNFEPRIRAVYSQSQFNRTSGISFANCINNGRRTLPADRIRIVNGESDTTPLGSRDPNEMRRELQAISGASCAATDYVCLRPNGSGWYMVRDAEAQDGVADHCYHHVNGCSLAPTLDAGYAPPAATPWSLTANLDWLKQFTTA